MAAVISYQGAKGLIGGQRRSTEVIRGHQRSSHLRLLEAPSEVIKGDEWRSHLRLLEARLGRRPERSESELLFMP